MRSTATPSAPACSRAAVACSATRPNRPPPERTETEAQTSLLPRPAGLRLVGDVEGDGAARGEREAAVAGLVDLDVEADALADQLAGDAHPRAGAEPARRRRRRGRRGPATSAGTQSVSVSTSSTTAGSASMRLLAVQVFMGRDDPAPGVACRRPDCRSCRRRRNEPVSSSADDAAIVSPEDDGTAGRATQCRAHGPRRARSSSPACGRSRRYRLDALIGRARRRSRCCAEVLLGRRAARRAAAARRRPRA